MTHAVGLACLPIRSTAALWLAEMPSAYLRCAARSGCKCIQLRPRRVIRGIAATLGIVAGLG